MKASKLQEEFPQAHRILSELHFIKKLNEDLFQQLDDSRIAIDEIADKLPCASSALRGVRHILDCDGGGSSTIGNHPAATLVTPASGASADANAPAAAGDGVEENPILRTKKKLLQFVDDAVEKVATKSAGVAAAASSAVQPQQSAKQLHDELQCLRLKIVAHENAKKALDHAKSRIDDLREELKTCRSALRDANEELRRTARERDTLRAELKAATTELSYLAQQTSTENSGREPNPHGAPDAGAGGSDGVPAAQNEDPLGRKVNDLFDDLFATGSAASAQTTSARHSKQHGGAAADDLSAPSSSAALAGSRAAVVQLSEELALLEKSKREAEAKTGQLEATLTAAALEAEGLRSALAALNANRSSLDEANDALAHKLEAAVTQLASQTQELTALREAAKKGATVTEAHRVLSDEVKQLRAQKQQLEAALGEATAKLLSETQRREEAQREVLALQRMLNSVELRDDLCGAGVERSRPDGPSTGWPSNGTATSTSMLSRGDENGSSAPRSQGGKATEDTEEELFKMRQALRMSNKHRVEAESALRRVTKQHRIALAMCRHSAQTVGELALRAAASNECLRRIEEQMSHRQSPRERGGAEGGTPSRQQHSMEVSLSRSHTAVVTTPPDADIDDGAQGPSLQNPDHEVLRVDGSQHARWHPNERPERLVKMANVEHHDRECQTTHPMPCAEIQQLQADNRVLAHTVEELQEALRSATSSMVLSEACEDPVPSTAVHPRQPSTSLSVLTSLPSTSSLSVGVDELGDATDATPPTPPSTNRPPGLTSPPSTATTTTIAPRADARSRLDGCALQSASHHATPAATPQRTNASSFSPSPSVVATVPPVAGSSKRLGGFFQFMRRNNNSAGNSKPSALASTVASSSTTSSDAVSRQQLKVVQRLLEAQLRENLELQQRVEVLEDALKKSHRT